MRSKSQFQMKPFTWVLVAILAVQLMLIGIGCIMFATPFYKGPASEHFDGRHFYNPEQIGRRGFFDVLKWRFTREPGPWLPWIENPPADPVPARVGKGELHVTFIGHSTVLLQMDGQNILIDPFFSERTGPFDFMGLRRHRPPGIRIKDLPQIDIVLISHNHYDHMDMPALLKLAEKFHPRFITGLGNAALLKKHGIDRVEEKDWWDQTEIADGIVVDFVPSQHFSGRSLCDRNRSLWGGFMIIAPAGMVYFASDTGMGPHFQKIRQRFGPPRLALLPIGAYRPHWFMAPMHLSPEETVRVHKALGAGTSMAIHFGTLQLGDDGQFEPVIALSQALADQKVSPADFWALEPGQGRDVPVAHIREIP